MAALSTVDVAVEGEGHTDGVAAALSVCISLGRPRSGGCRRAVIAASHPCAVGALAGLAAALQQRVPGAVSSRASVQAAPNLPTLLLDVSFLRRLSERSLRRVARPPHVAPGCFVRSAFVASFNSRRKRRQGSVSQVAPWHKDRAVPHCHRPLLPVAPDSQSSRSWQFNGVVMISTASSRLNGHRAHGQRTS